jgi:ABC-2 type transport system permease protein
MSTSSTRGTGSLWRVVAQREISTRVREKSFLITTAISFVIILGGIVGVHLFQGRDQDRTVAVVDQAAVQVVDAAALVAKQLDDRVTLSADRVADARAAERAVEDGRADAALLATSDGYEILGDRSVDTTVSQALQAAVSTTALERNAASQDVDLTALQAGTAAQERLLDPASKDAGIRQATAYGFIILFFITALGFGMAIAGSVTQEKESRVVEILAAAVPFRQLLWGKIAGSTVLAIGQVALLVAAAAIGLGVTDQLSGLGVIAPAMLSYVGFFVVGFVALASLWAVAGSLASRQQDLQSTTSPAQMLLMIPYFVFFFAGEGVKEVMSMVPIVSTMMMPARMAEGAVPLWQIAVGLGGTIVVAALMVRVGARVYERTLLRTGDKISYREALTARAD